MAPLGLPVYEDKPKSSKNKKNRKRRGKKGDQYIDVNDSVDEDGNAKEYEGFTEEAVESEYKVN